MQNTGEQDMYEGVTTGVKSVCEEMEEFRIGLEAPEFSVEHLLVVVDNQNYE